MDQIIRAAVLSDKPRQLRRPGRADAAAPASTPLYASAPDLPADVTTDRREKDMQEERRQREHESALAALRAKEAELAQARESLKAEIADVLADAQRRGHALGKEAAEAEAQAAVSAQVSRLAELAGALAQSRQQRIEECEDMLVEIAHTAICRMIGETATTRAGLAALVRTQITQMSGSEHIVVRLHPEDLATLRQALAGAEGMDLAQRVDLQADPGVVLGGCLVDGPRGTLDARLELQLEALGAALMTARRSLDRGDTL